MYISIPKKEILYQNQTNEELPHYKAEITVFGTHIEIKKFLIEVTALVDKVNKEEEK